jgi:uncharacterized protein
MMLHTLINLVITFLFIVFLLRKKLHLGLVMFLAAVLLGILFQVNLINQLLTVKRAIISPTFLQLGVALNIIMFLENVLRNKGYLQKTLHSLKVLIPNPKINMLILPAFLGLLPSSGGAVFSAPLVAAAGKDLGMSAEEKSQVNYWFRHLWEFFFPLYPGIILAAKILALPVGKISLTLCWFFFIAVITGYFLIVRKIGGTGVKMEVPIESRVPDQTLRSELDKKRALFDLLAGIWPVVLIVLVVLVFHADVGLTVVSILVLLLFMNRYRPQELKKLWRESFAVSLIYLIAGILIFKEMLQTSGVVDLLPVYLKSMGIPDLLVVICLTFLVAFSTGISQAYIATTFPLLLGIIGTGSGIRPGMMILAFISGFVGIMLSPVHLCLVLTVQYYKADFVKVWRSVIIPSAVLLLAAILFAFFWK